VRIDNTNIGNYNIPDGATIHLGYAKQRELKLCRLIVRQGAQVFMVMFNGNATVGYMKQTIYLKRGIIPSKQVFKKNSVELTDGRTLFSYNIQHDCTVDLIRAPI
jgi:ABC-type hemin transport system ATPase subunit